MSKAFVNEDGAVEEAPALPARPPQPLPITVRGREALARERASLDAASWRARVIARVLETVTVRVPAFQGGGVGFGCVVVVRHEAGSPRTYEGVGADEAAPERGRIGVTSPLARSLLGKKPGDVVVVRKPKVDEELEVVGVRLPT